MSERENKMPPLIFAAVPEDMSEEERGVRYAVETPDGFYGFKNATELAAFASDLYAYIMRKVPRDRRGAVTVKFDCEYDPDEFDIWCDTHKDEFTDEIPVEESLPDDEDDLGFDTKIISINKAA